MFNQDFREINEKIFDHYRDEYEKAAGSDIVIWTESIKGIKLHWYQKILLNSIVSNKRVAWRCGRRIGKTMLMKIAAEYFENKSSNMIGIVCGANLMHERLYKELSIEYETFPNIRLMNGKNYLNLSKGFNFSHLFFDDASYMDEKVIDHFLMLYHRKDNIKTLMASNPSHNRVFDVFCNLNDVVEYYFPTYVNPNYNHVNDEEHKSQLDKIRYSEEIKAKYYEEEWIEGLYR